MRTKLSRDATSAGAGFTVPVNVVKDSLDANGLLERLPSVRLRPGVRHSLDWKQLAGDLPEKYLDFVNGRYLSGAKPFEEFAKVINAELTRLNVPVPAGAPAG